MNPIAEDISRYIGCSEWDEEQLAHYGMPRRSGRYPWGSGDNPYQHGKDFLALLMLFVLEIIFLEFTI